MLKIENIFGLDNKTILNKGFKKVKNRNFSLKTTNL